MSKSSGQHQPWSTPPPASRLAEATRALAHARAAAAELGIAQWCEGCDEAMPARRAAALCPRCTARANKNRWARDDRAAARLTREST